VGESGVGMNFLTSLACLSQTPVTITGAKRITERPVAEVVSGLAQLGCKIEYLKNEGYPPIKIYGDKIPGGTAKIKGEKSSQYFSSIVISSPYADHEVILKCVDTMTEKPYFDISLQMMSNFGVKAENNNYKEMIIPPGQKYIAQEVTVEGDYSSASFFFLAAAICKTKITVTGLNPETKQGDKQFLSLIEKMGCEISEKGRAVCVQGKQLRAIERDMGNIPDLVPPFAVAAAFA
ncbi:unnamed protein product, partial [marine sediment metagenome]